MIIRVSCLWLLCVCFLSDCTSTKVSARTTFRREGSRLIVPEDGDFQAALNAAQPGDTVVLTSGRTYRGQFVLPPKTGAGVITIQSSDLSRLPGPGMRVGKEHAQWMAKIVCSQCPALDAPAGAHHYRIAGVEIHPAPGSYAYELVRLGDHTVKTVAEQAHDLELDHVIIHGDAAKGAKRGVVLNARAVTIANSMLYDFKTNGQDTQGIAGWAGPGPFRIVNNYIEASGENVLFGGAAPQIHNLVPSDIEVAHNHFFKPPAWRAEGWLVKNLFELKNARNVRVHGNVFENNWPSGQNGFGIVLTVRTCEAGNYPWSVVEDVDFSDNIIRGSEHGITLLGMDDMRNDCGGGVAGKAANIRIRNNFIDSVERGFMILRTVNDLVIEHNTVMNRGNLVMTEGEASAGFVYRNNIAAHNDYGLTGAGKGSGTAAMKVYFPGAVFRGNVVVGAPGEQYPAGNFYPSKAAQVGFVNAGAKDYRLGANSPYRKKGTDNRDPGVDFDELERETAGVVEGRMAASAGR